MLNISLRENGRLLSGTRWMVGGMHLPKEGGGFRLDEIMQKEARYLNLTLTVMEEHSMTFELRVNAEQDG